MTLIFDLLHSSRCDTMGIYRNICLPGLVKIRRIVLEIYRRKWFYVCASLDWWVEGIMFLLISSFPRPFVRYKSYLGQRPRSQEVAVRFGDLAKASFSASLDRIWFLVVTYFGLVWPWPLTSWPQNWLFHALARGTLCQLASLTVHSFSKYRVRKFDYI